MSQNIKLTLHFNDPDLDAEVREQAVQQLFAQMKEMDEVETVKRIHNQHPLAHQKVALETLIGILTAEVSRKNFAQVMTFVGRQVGNRRIELEVEDNGRKLKLVVNHRDDLELAVNAAQQFVSQEELCKK